MSTSRSCCSYWFFSRPAYPVLPLCSVCPLGPARPLGPVCPSCLVRTTQPARPVRPVLGKVMSQEANKLQMPFSADLIYSRDPISNISINYRNHFRPIHFIVETQNQRRQQTAEALFANTI